MPRVSRARFVLALSVLVKERPRHLSARYEVYIAIRIQARKLLGFYSLLESRKVLSPSLPFLSLSRLRLRLRHRHRHRHRHPVGVSTVVRSREQQWDVLLYRAKRRNFSLNIVITFTRVSHRFPPWSILQSTTPISLLRFAELFEAPPRRSSCE